MENVVLMSRFCARLCHVMIFLFLTVRNFRGNVRKDQEHFSNISSSSLQIHPFPLSAACSPRSSLGTTWPLTCNHRKCTAVPSPEWAETVQRSTSSSFMLQALASAGEKWQLLSPESDIHDLEHFLSPPALCRWRWLSHFCPRWLLQRQQRWCWFSAAWCLSLGSLLLVVCRVTSPFTYEHHCVTELLTRPDPIRHLLFLCGAVFQQCYTTLPTWAWPNPVQHAPLWPSCHTWSHHLGQWERLLEGDVMHRSRPGQPLCDPADWGGGRSGHFCVSKQLCILFTKCLTYFGPANR